MTGKSSFFKCRGHFILSTLDELQAAIEAAEDGDMIVLLNVVNIDSTEQDGIDNITIGSKEKTITLTPADDFTNQSLFYLYHVNGSISFENIIMDGRLKETTAIRTTYLLSEVQTNIILSILQSKILMIVQEHFSLGISKWINVYLRKIAHPVTVDNCFLKKMLMSK